MIRGCVTPAENMAIASTTAARFAAVPSYTKSVCNRSELSPIATEAFGGSTARPIRTRSSLVPGFGNGYRPVKLGFSYPV